jgi:hypothetical protein
MADTMRRARTYATVKRPEDIGQTLRPIAKNGDLYDPWPDDGNTLRTNDS